MKRIIAVLLAIVLLSGIALSAAEESGKPADFLQALSEWAQKLNPDESDYSASVKWSGSPGYQGTLRKDQEITEIELAGLGKAQVSENKLMLDIGGKKFGIDLSRVLNLIKSWSSGKSEKKGLLKNLEMVKPWLEKAFKEIILPCVRINYSYDGVSIHIDADDEKIMESTYALIDEIMAERNTLETLLNQYGPYLARFIPNMPKTFEELAKAWEFEKEHRSIHWRDFNFGADITYSTGNGGLSVSGRINLYLQGLFGAGLTIELKTTDEGADLIASLEVTNDRSPVPQFSGKLAFHCVRDKVEGVLEIGEHTYTLKAERKNEEHGRNRYTASLTGMDGDGVITMKYELEAIYDPADKTIKVALYEIKDAGTSFESRNELAALDVYAGILGWEGELKLPFGILSLNLNLGDHYTRLKLEHTGLTRLDSWYVDAWLYYAPKDYMLKVETNLADQAQRKASLYTLAFRENEIEFSISDKRETTHHAKFTYRRTMNGFEAEIEYLNKWERIPVISTRIKPSTLKIVREGNRYTADLDWSVYGKTILGATGTLDLDEAGAFQKLSIDATQYNLLGIGKDRDYHLTVTPEAITYADRSGIYELRIVENTAERLAVVLTKDYKDELGSLVLTLDDQGAFSGVLTVMGKETGSIMIRPIPKEPIEKISEDDALMIDFHTLRFLSFLIKK